MKSLSDFQKAHKKKIIWVGVVTTIVIILFIVLAPDWFNVRGFIYPLNEGIRNIGENLFWAFSTGALFMWFEKSVNDDAVIMEIYRDIRMNTKPLESCDLLDKWESVCKSMHEDIYGENENDIKNNELDESYDYLFDSYCLHHTLAGMY